MKFIIFDFFLQIFTKANNSYIHLQGRVLKFFSYVFTSQVNLAGITSIVNLRNTFKLPGFESVKIS